MENLLIQAPQENVRVQINKEMIFIKILAPQKLVKVKKVNNQNKQIFVRQKKALLRLFNKSKYNPKYFEELKSIENIRAQRNYSRYNAY